VQHSQRDALTYLKIFPYKVSPDKEELMASLSFIQARKLVDLIQLATKSGDMYVRVVSSSRLALGKDPMSPTVTIDLSKEAVVPFSDQALPAIVESSPKVSKERATRRSGDYWFELHGKRSEFNSLGELLAEALRSLEVASHGTLEKLSLIKPRSKRIVARDKRMLFAAQHLSEEFSEKLMPGWWYGTNNSTQETNAWLRRACDCAVFKWGVDFRSSLSG
jgi:hypothetical protein